MLDIRKFRDEHGGEIDVFRDEVERLIVCGPNEKKAQVESDLRVKGYVIVACKTNMNIPSRFNMTAEKTAKNFYRG